MIIIIIISIITIIIIIITIIIITIIRYDVIVMELDEMVAEGYYIPGKKTTEKIKLKAKPPGI
jgi:hypothetical protein